ncbi:MAG TPA: GtrA family protein [Candidatus Marinimicrobia bacterium]|nr:GtrA family protein [Candidatus Neomarinimicrobiota bacterium]
MILKFTKFTIRGIAGGIVDTLILWLLSTYLFNSYFAKYILAPSISFEVSIFFTYTICYFWIWNHRVNNSKSDFFRRIPGYNAAALISFAVKMALLITIERIFHFDVVICNLLALSVSGFVNFFAVEKHIFKKCNICNKGNDNE